MSKGHVQRPTTVTEDERAARWARTFGIAIRTIAEKPNDPKCACGERLYNAQRVNLDDAADTGPITPWCPNCQPGQLQQTVGIRSPMNETLDPP
jgi:hypothetical protein